MRNSLIPYLATILLVIVGCASQKAAVSDRNESKQIIDIVINENSDSLVLSIQGNQKLQYIQEKGADPKEIFLVFPDTTLEGIKGRFIPPENDIISSVMAVESIEIERINSTVNIELKEPAPYQLTSIDDGLLVTFAKKIMDSHHAKPQMKDAEIKPESGHKQNIAPAATVLRKVVTQSLDQSIEVDIKADGRITEYNSFTMNNPARIVFDLYNIKSPHTREQRMIVQSKEVNLIRYFGHPDKLRLVIETHKRYLSGYSSTPTNTGLKILIRK